MKWNNINMVNGQSAALNLSNEQIQVLITGKFGDGCLIKTPMSVMYSACCIHEEYIDYKSSLLGDLFQNKHCIENKGFKNGMLYRVYSKANPRVALICDESFEDSFNRMDSLGFALWIYDDGTKHKDKEFYQISTQKFSREIQEDIFVPGLKDKFDINAKVTPEIKKDGREYWYLRIGKFDGSYEISNILSQYPIQCYNYKVWSSETIQKWSRFQEESKSANIDIKSLNYREINAKLRHVSI